MNSLNAREGPWLDRWCRGEVRQRIEQNWDTRMVIVGEPGVGKSTLALIILKLIDPTFDMDRIVYDARGVMDQVLHLPKGSAILLDEAGEIVTANRHMTTQNTTLRRMWMGARYKGLVWVMVSPNWEDIDKGMRRMVRYLVVVYGRGNARVYDVTRSPFKKESGTRLRFEVRYPDVPIGVRERYDAQKSREGQSRLLRYRDDVSARRRKEDAKDEGEGTSLMDRVDLIVADPPMLAKMLNKSNKPDTDLVWLLLQGTGVTRQNCLSIAKGLHLQTTMEDSGRDSLKRAIEIKEGT